MYYGGVGLWSIRRYPQRAGYFAAPLEVGAYGVSPWVGYVQAPLEVGVFGERPVYAPLEVWW